MAGFYYFYMGLIFGCVLIGAAIAGSITLVQRVKRRLPIGLPGRRYYLSAYGVAPFFGAIWLVAAIILHVQISNRLAHQDSGFSGDPYVTLPNGYVLGSLNTYDGYIRAPGFKTSQPITGAGYVRSLIDVELKGDDFVGTLRNFNTDEEWSFIFNTRDRSFQASDTGRAISFEETQNRVHSDPNSYWKLYKKYRHHWPAVVFLDLIAIGEGAIIVALRRFWTVIQRRVLLASLS